MMDMKRKTALSLFVLLFLAGMLFSSCGSSVNMHRHNRSHCDCPSF